MWLKEHRKMLWFGEKAFVCAMEHGYQTNFNLTVQYRNKFSKAQLSQAFRRLIFKHPIFAYTYFREGTSQDDERTNGDNLEKRPFEMLCFDDVFVFIKLDAPLGVDELQDINTIKFHVNSGKPTYRIAVHEFGDIQYLSFVSDHAMRDGNSSVYFHQDFLAEIRKDDDEEFCQILFSYHNDIEKMKPIYPPLDRLSPVFMLPLSLPWAIWKLMVGFFYLFFTFAPKFHVEPITTNYRCKFKHFNIPQWQLERILQFVKANNATLTPYITAVGHRALQDNVVAEFGEFSSNVRISINARRYFPKLQEELRYSICVASHNTTFPPDPRPIMDNLHTVQHQLQQTLATPLFFAERSLLQLVNIWKFLKGVEGTTNFLENFCVSNIGMIQNDDIVNLWFSQDSNAFANMVISVVSTPQGGLNIVTSYHENLDVNGSIDNFLVQFREDLLRVAGIQL